MLEVWANHKERVEKHKKIKGSGQAIEFLLCAGRKVDGQELEAKRRFSKLKRDK